MIGRTFGAPRARAVLVHYHLFKNGGTSIERLLRDAFGEGWASWDRPEPGASIAGADMQAWIEAHPRIRAVSSHQLVPPLPRGDFAVVPIVFLREPMLRVRSAWRFEWQKQLGLDEPKGSLAEYIESKFVHARVSVIANFHVSRLANVDYEDARAVPGRDDEELVAAACRFVDTLPFVGLVDRFAESLALLGAASRERFPDLEVREYRENVLESGGGTIEERIGRLRVDLGDELFGELERRNALDRRLYAHAGERFEAQLRGLRDEGCLPAVRHVA